ncbi:MAG: thiamine pyrophosphate-dependent enzyme [Candidatus Ranarchaeia archaeon]
MGNEAIARGAIEAGLDLAAAYPGTPSSEILETLAESAAEMKFHAQWSTNECVAFEIAAGAAMVGGRALFATKNAGLNVVMDPFMTIPYGGIKGGFVIVCADDPRAYYSSTEQDTRVAARYADILCFEPCDQQEAKDMTKVAFELSEEMKLPVFIRSVTRLSHASGDVELGDIRKERNPIMFDKHGGLAYKFNVYGPPGPDAKHQWLKDQQPKILEYVEKSPWNILDIVGGSEIGIISSGMGKSFTREAIANLGLNISTLELGTPSPIPEKKVKELLNKCKQVLIVEEGDPVIENQVRSYAKLVAPNVEIYGKTYRKVEGESTLSMVGELTPDLVEMVIAKFAGKSVEKIQDSRIQLKEELGKLVSPRSSMWCEGCPHIGSFHALKKALQENRAELGNVWITNVGIGCYEMSGYGIFGKPRESSSSEKSKPYPNLTPYEFADTIYVMGSESGIPQGQWHAGYKDGKAIGIMGDSSFFHTNLPGIVNAVYNHANVMFLVLDNFITAMTGHQPNPSTGLTAMGMPAFVPKIEDIVKAFGIKYVEVADAYDLEGSQKAIDGALKYEGPSVVVLRRICALEESRNLRKQKIQPDVYEVIPDKCTGCKICVRLGCPSISFDSETKKASINLLSCIGCKLCVQVCPENAHKLIKGGAK